MGGEGDWLRVGEHYASVSRLAYQVLRQGILSCRLSPGSRISVAALAERMGISRTPVRDALQRLEAEGLVISVPRSQTRIAELSHREMNDLYAVRMILEGPAGEQAAAYITPEQLEHLRRLVAEAEGLVAAGNHEGFAANNTAFHTTIYAASPNRELSRLTQDLRSRSQRYIVTFTRAPGRDQEILADHRLIVAALAARDPVRSRTLMEQHLDSAWAWLREQLG